MTIMNLDEVTLGHLASISRSLERIATALEARQKEREAVARAISGELVRLRR